MNTIDEVELKETLEWIERTTEQMRRDREVPATIRDMPMDAAAREAERRR